MTCQTQLAILSTPRPAAGGNEAVLGSSNVASGNVAETADDNTVVIDDRVVVAVAAVREVDSGNDSVA